MDKHQITNEERLMMSDWHIVMIQNTIAESMATHMTAWNELWLERKKHNEDEDKLMDRFAALN